MSDSNRHRKDGCEPANNGSLRHTAISAVLKVDFITLSTFMSFKEGDREKQIFKCLKYDIYLYKC